VAWVGVPATLVVGLYFSLVGHRLLPVREGAASWVGRRGGDLASGYQFDLRVKADAPFAGRTVEAAGLRTLGNAFLAHIRRRDGSGGYETEEARPEAILLPGDVLTFVGDAAALNGLLTRPGLERKAPVLSTKGGRPPANLSLFEAVVAPGSRLVGHTLKGVGFREQYGGVVLAIQRRDAPLHGALGRIPLRAGDLLLIEGRRGFAQRLAGSDFVLVVPLEAPRPVPGKAPIALGLLLGVLVLGSVEAVPLPTAAFVAALGMVATGCLRGRPLRQSVDVPVLLVIAAAIGLGHAFETTGLADVAASGLLVAAGEVSPVVMLALLYAVTTLTAELITNKPTVVLMVPIALAVASDLGLDPTPFAMVVNVGAAAAFLTPIGHHTNLMVMGAGGYRYTDYFRSGLPAGLLVMAVTVAMCALVWL
jgi:di/tricarboxylate transporter